MIVHLNGELVPRAEARLDPFDRGFLFADGVYEGLRADGGRVIAAGYHADRLAAGLRECGISGFDAGELEPMTEGLLRANGLSEAFVYWQVTRGAPAAGRPVRARLAEADQRPTVFGYAEEVEPVSSWSEPRAVEVATVRDDRWTRGHIKSVSLLPGVLAAIEAGRRGAEDAVFVRGRRVAEAVASNVFLVRGGEIATPSLESASILAGVTRRLIIEELPGVAERAVWAEELASAEEVVLAGTRSMVSWVRRVDGRLMGEGPGEGARAMLEALVRAVASGRGSDRGSGVRWRPLDEGADAAGGGA